MIHRMLQGRQLVLASQSPRRKLIFQQLGLKAVRMPSDIVESSVSKIPRNLVRQHSELKVRDVMKKVDADCIVVGADTVVSLNKRILGKPTSQMEARHYLEMLSGHIHQVYTGITVGCHNLVLSDFARTRVEFLPLSPDEINQYIATGEPMDKAGAYGIQGYGSQFIRSISGCYFNVMGFPITTFRKLLEELFEML